MSRVLRLLPYVVILSTLPPALAQSNLPPPVDNSVKYRDNGAHSATGRSGNATLSALALIASNSVTDLYLAASSVTDATKVGVISKVQVKGFDLGNHLIFTTNVVAPSGGSLTHLSLTNLAAHFSIQVQANVDGIDKRTDVVTVTSVVERRPFLQPQRPRRGLREPPGDGPRDRDRAQ